MKISTKLGVFAAVPLAFTVGVVWIFQHNHRHVRVLRADVRLANHLVKQMFDLNLLTHDFVRHGEDRAREQWEGLHQSLRRKLEKNGFRSGEAKSVVESIEREHEAIGAAFEHLAEWHRSRRIGRGDDDAHKDFEDRLVTQLTSHAVRLVSYASELAQGLRGRAEAAQRKTERLALVLLVAVSLVLAAGALLTMRAVTEPLRRLQSGAAQIAQGQLDERIPAGGRDEFAQVAETFNEMADSLQRSGEAVKQELERRRQAEERVVHLNAVLRAVRDVNQLIAQEKECDRLLEGACRRMVGTRGYGLAWIALLQDGKSVGRVFQAGGNGGASFEQWMKAGNLPRCAQAALGQDDVVLTSDKTRECFSCPISRSGIHGAALTARLRHGGRTYGVLGAEVEPSMAEDMEERTLFGELAGDVALALHALEAERQREQAEGRLNEQNRVTAGINRVLQQALTCRTEEEVAECCLDVAQDLTGSQFGFVGEINEEGRFDTIALSDPGWEACRMEEPEATRSIRGMEIRGIWGRTILDGSSQVVNAPDSHPDRVGTPPGHPPITSFLGVPFRQGERTIGMIALANKAEGFSEPDRQAIETLSVAFAEALYRKRADIQLQRHQQHLEHLVEARTQELSKTLSELERSNKELEQFAYVASHDLQEPLRMVSSFTELLAKRYRGSLDEKADKYINYVVSGAARMQTMINDLLAYSRVGTRGRPFESTDLNALVGDVLQNLRIAIEEGNAEISREPLPTLSVDPSQMRQLFQNLIGNAIKFCGGGPPQIHIGAKEEEACWQFRVQDNGIGMENKYLERVFIIFQRLHGRDQYPGSGIGLSICKKIVERHGGRIWVESKPGEGSNFLFTIPKRGGVSE